MKLRQILDILFWIMLATSIVLLLWYIFGNSPTELAITITFILTLLLKVWSISDNLKDFQHKTALSFHKVREETDKVKENMKVIGNKIETLGSQINYLSKSKRK